MFCSIDDFSKTWNTEKEKTLRLINAISNDSLKKELIPDYMTIGRLIQHMVNNLCNTSPKLGFDAIEKPEDYDHVGKIAQGYKQVAEELLKKIESKWTNAALNEKMDIFGEQLPRSEVLSIIFLHQIHHRSQITVLMRLADLDVPGMYGPSASDKRKQ